MGHRANLVIVRNHSYELYYSHWCATTLPEDLFWGEPYAVQFIEAQRRVDETEWLDDVWAEGGVVLDLEKKKLLFYGGEDLHYDLPLRQLFLKLMRQVWDGWEINWAHEGIVDLASYVGYPKEKVLTGRNKEANDASLAPPEKKHWVDTVGSVKFSQSELLLFPLSGAVEKYLVNGPEMVKRINKSFGYKSLALAEWTEYFPQAGFHIDVEQKRVEFWHADDIPNISQIMKEIWTDWAVIDYGNDYGTLSKSTCGQLHFQHIDQQQLLENIKGMLLRENSRKNPFDAILPFLQKEADEGKKVEINPHALRFDRTEVPGNTKADILQYAIDHL